MQYCTRNPSIKKPELSDAASIIDINDNMDVIDGIICKNNFNGATDPGTGDDIGDGYAVNSHWWNTTGHKLFVAESVATGAAVWRQVYPIECIRTNGRLSNVDPSLTYNTDCPVWIQTAGLQLAMGRAATAPYEFWMQTRQTTNVSWPLVLNPLGGKVGIGLSNPQAQLHIITDCLISGADYPAYLLASRVSGAKRWGMVSSAEDFIIRNVTNGVNIVHIYNSGGMSIGSSVTDPGANNLYVTGDVNCASVTDHTPGYSGDALKELKHTRSNAQGKIIHQTLPRFARAKFIDATTGEETEGRNIGNMVSVLTRAVQQLIEKLEVAERKIEQLEEEIQ